VVTSNTSSSDSGLCVYCGEPATTEDHVPPKNLFPSNTTGILKVPACLSCNRGSSKDDEFFRGILVNDDRIYQNSEASEIVAAYERSLRRPQAIGLHITMMKMKKRFPLISPTGLIYGEGTVIKTDFVRERKVLERITKGLFFHEFQRPHPPNNSINAFSSKHMQGRKDRLDTVLELLSFMKPANKKGANPEIFKYGFGVAEDNADGTFWVLTFYNKIPFFIYSTPPAPQGE